MDIVPSAWAMPSLRKSHTVSAKSLPKTTIRNSKIKRIPVAAGRNGTYSGMAESPFCADFHPSQSRRTGEILLLRRQRSRIGRRTRVGEPRRGWQRVKGRHLHTQAHQASRPGTLPPPHRQVRAVSSRLAVEQQIRNGIANSFSSLKYKGIDRFIFMIIQSSRNFLHLCFREIC